MNLDEMVVLTCTVTALEPLHIGTGTAVGNFMPTHHHVPARVIRGVLGNYLFNHDRKLFDKLRIADDENPQILFKPAVPLFKPTVPKNAVLEDCMYTPAGLYWCKKCGKLLKNGVRECDRDGHEGKRRSGWMRRGSLADGVWQAPAGKIEEGISTKCPIVPSRHTSFSGTEDDAKSPYNIESIPRRATFRLKIVLPSNHVDDVRDALVAAGLFYGAGGFRSRGYGMVAFDDFSSETTGSYVERRSVKLGEHCVMVCNSEMVVAAPGGYEVGFGENFIKTLSTQVNSLCLEKPIVNLDTAHVRPATVRGFTVKDGPSLEPLIPATGPGSSISVSIDPKTAAVLELVGMGQERHVHGDIYFIPEVSS